MTQFLSDLREKIREAELEELAFFTFMLLMSLTMFLLMVFLLVGIIVTATPEAPLQ